MTKEIKVSSVSVAGDRRYALTSPRADGTLNFVDSTKFPGLLQYKTAFANPDKPKTSEVIVVAPDGETLSAIDPKLNDRMSQEYGQRVSVLNLGRAIYHSMPVSLVSFGTVSRIREYNGGTYDARALRANILLNFVPDGAFLEDPLVGYLLSAGSNPDSAVLAGVKLDQRCATVDLDPLTGKRIYNVLSHIEKRHAGTAGIYCSILREGVIRQRDILFREPISF